MLELLTYRSPTRIALFIRPPSHQFRRDALDNINEALALLEQTGTEYIYLAWEQWDTIDILVFDLWNDAYDFMTAHEPIDLPVVIVDFGRTNTRISIASPMYRREVNDGVAQHHRLNGWDVGPPFVADCTGSNRPSYPSPRDQYPMAQLAAAEQDTEDDPIANNANDPGTSLLDFSHIEDTEPESKTLCVRAGRKA